MSTENSGSILLVDDDASFRLIVANLLKGHGYRVVEAANADEATSLFADRETKLAIVDYRMPGTDGISWIQNLRETGRATPIIFVSAEFCDQNTFNWLRNILKVSLIVKKPIIPDVFIQQVESLLPAPVRIEFPEGIAVEQEHEHEQEQSSPPSALLNQLLQIRSKLEVKTAMKIAQANYVHGLDGEWNSLVTTINALKNDPRSLALLDESVNMAHKIKGTAGSLNLGRLGEIAAQIENFMRMIDPDDSTQTDVIWSEVFRSLANGEQFVKAAVNEQGPIKIEKQATTRVLLVGTGYSAIADEQRTVSLHVVESAASVQAKLKRTTYDAAIFDLTSMSKEHLFDLSKEVRLAAGESVPIALISPGLNQLTTADLAYVGCSEVVSEVSNTVQMEALLERLIKTRCEQKQRIMIVDDDPVLCNFVETVLSAQGYDLHSVNNPIKTEEEANHFKPDLILLDVMMPGMTGYEVCRLLRESSPWQKTPIVFLTGKTSAESRAAAFHAGADDFLSKPVVMEELITRVTSQLERTAKEGSRLSKDETGMLKEEVFVNAATDLLNQSLSAGEPVTVALLAVDEAAVIRVVHGIDPLRHVITELALGLKARFKAEDVRGRLGYDGFALVASGQEKAIIAAALEKLLAVYSDTKFTGEQGPFKVTFSAGLADSIADASNGASLYDLLGHAQRRMVAHRKERAGAISSAG